MQLDCKHGCRKQIAITGLQKPTAHGYCRFFIRSCLFRFPPVVRDSSPSKQLPSGGLSSPLLFRHLAGFSADTHFDTENHCSPPTSDLHKQGFLPTGCIFCGPLWIFNYIMTLRRGSSIIAAFPEEIVSPYSKRSFGDSPCRSSDLTVQCPRSISVWRHPECSDLFFDVGMRFPPSFLSPLGFFIRTRMFLNGLMFIFVSYQRAV